MHTIRPGALIIIKAAGFARCIIKILAATLFLSRLALGATAPVRCEIGIVGGGPAGVYLAYRLAPRYGERLCLFEKEAELGGRMRDEPVSDSPEAIRIGTGARRVNATQDFVLALARELGVEFETPEKRSQLMQHRGRFAYSSDAFRSLYPGLNAPDETALYGRILSPANTSKAGQYPTLRAYLTAIGGADTISFLRASSRFHADFDYELSPANYLETLRHENALSPVNLYPIGGMSTFVRKMEARCLSNHVRIFKAEPVLEIEKQKRAAAAEYRLRTPRRQALVQRLVLAVPPIGLDRIQGDIATSVRAAPEYKALLPIRIVVINQVWSQRWWSDVRDPAGSGDSARTWRAWSTDHCVTHVEFPQESYAAAANVSRSVYTDDPKCAKHWEKLRARGGLTAVEHEVAAGLSSLFRVTIPKPLRTTMHVWPAGWYYVRAGTTVSNQRIAQWSIEPVRGDTNLMLLGEAYWPDRPGWSEGAYFSAKALLAARFQE